MRALSDTVPYPGPGRTHPTDLEDDLEPLIPAGTKLRDVIDALPTMLLVSDWDANIVDANLAAQEWMGFALGPDMKPGDVLKCSFAREPGGCGATEACVSCLVRGSLKEIRPGGPASRRLAHAVLVRDGRSSDHWFRVTATPMTLEDRPVVLLALDDLTQVVELREALPVCPGCQSPRDPADVLHEARHYLKRHPGVLASRELCPRCLRDKAPVPYEEDVL